MHRRPALWQQTLISALTQIIVLALLVVMVVALIEYFAPSLRETLVDQISARIDGHVTAEALTVDWSPAGPALALDRVRVWRAGAAAPAARIKRVHVTLSAAAIADGRRAPYAVTLKQPRIQVAIAPSGRPRLVHWSRAGDPPLTWMKVDHLRERMARLVVRGARITVAAPSLPGGSTDISGLRLTLSQSAPEDNWRLTFAGNASDWRAHAAGHIRFRGAAPDFTCADFSLSARTGAPLALVRGARAESPKGSLKISLDGRWRDHRLKSSRGTLALRLPGDKPLAPLSLQATLRASQTAADAPIAVTLVESRSSVVDLDALMLSARIDPDAQRIRLQGGHLPGTLLAAVARRLAPTLAQTRVHAAIPAFSLAAGGDQAFELDADFRQLRVAGPRLALGPVRGSYHQTGAQHGLTLEHAGGTLAIERFIRGKLPVDDASGRVTWRHSSDGLRVDFNELSLTSNNAQATLNGRIEQPAARPLRVNLKATLRAPRLAPLIAHVPQGPDLPNAKLRDWLAKAVDRATVKSASAQIRGALKDFPFAGKDSVGAFRLAVDATDVTLSYKPGWPKLSNAAGHMTLDGTHLNARLANGRVGQVALADSSASIADVRKPVFKIDAHTAATRIEYLRRFIFNSPLRADIGGVIEALNAVGPVRVDANLAVPLKPGLPELKVDGDVHLAGDTLRQDALPAPLTHIRGDLRFTRDHVSARSINGRLLQLPIRASIEPTAADGHRITARAVIALPANRALLGHYMPKPWPRYLSGQTPIRLSFTIGPHGKRSPFRVRSDLTGLAIELPQPLAKPAPEPAPLAVTIAAAGDHVEARFDNRLTLRLELDTGHVTRIHALIGAHPPQPPDRDGIWIGGTAGRVDGPGWFHVVRRVLAESRSAGNKPAASAPKFIGADLTLDALTAGQRRLRDLHLVANRLRRSAPSWRISIGGRDAEGRLRVLDPSHGRLQISGRLDRMAIQTQAVQASPDTPATSADDETSSWPVLLPDASPLALPRVNLSVDNLSVDSTPLGELTLTARDQPNGWQLDQAALTANDLHASAQMRWTRAGGVTRASGEAEFSGSNLLNILRALGVDAPIRARTSRIQTRLRIAPNRDGLDLRALAGTAQLELTDGRLPQIEPGAARIVGLFNLSALPQRLLRGFDDLVKPGLAFSKFNAPMRFINGNLFTDNARIVTPSSNIAASGRVGLVSRDLNLRLVVTPKIGSTLTIASAILGGPIIGAAMFGVQQLLQQPLEQMSRVAFTIRGSWHNPVIVNPSADSDE